MFVLLLLMLSLQVEIWRGGERDSKNWSNSNLRNKKETGNMKKRYIKLVTCNTYLDILYRSWKHTTEFVRRIMRAHTYISYTYLYDLHISQIEGTMPTTSYWESWTLFSPSISRILLMLEREPILYIYLFCVIISKNTCIEKIRKKNWDAKQISFVYNFLFVKRVCHYCWDRRTTKRNYVILIITGFFVFVLFGTVR